MMADIDQDGLEPGQRTFLKGDEGSCAFLILHLHDIRQKEHERAVDAKFRKRLFFVQRIHAGDKRREMTFCFAGGITAVKGVEIKDTDGRGA